MRRKLIISLFLTRANQAKMVRMTRLTFLTFDWLLKIYGAQA